MNSRSLLTSLMLVMSFSLSSFAQTTALDRQSSEVIFADLVKEISKRPQNTKAICSYTNYLTHMKPTDPFYRKFHAWQAHALGDTLELMKRVEVRMKNSIGKRKDAKDRSWALHRDTDDMVKIYPAGIKALEATFNDEKNKAGSEYRDRSSYPQDEKTQSVLKTMAMMSQACDPDTPSDISKDVAIKMATERARDLRESSLKNDQDNTEQGLPRVSVPTRGSAGTN